jgi:hypothetical protein
MDVVLLSTIVEGMPIERYSYVVDELSCRRITGGFLVKGSRGGFVHKMYCNELSAKEHLLLQYRHSYRGKTYEGLLRSETLIGERVITYLRNYSGKTVTNCATFAEYLRTGIFPEDSNRENGMLFRGGVSWWCGQKIHPGDVLAVLYFSDMGRTRVEGVGFRGPYVKNKKKKELLPIRQVRGEIHNSTLVELFKSIPFGDFHFLHCLGHNNGQPVFVHQLGVAYSGERAPILITVGAMSPYADVPVCAFIKRAR